MAPKSTRNYTYVDVIRELRREASLGALRVLEEAEKLGVPRHVAVKLADRVMLYELTPREALARLRDLAAKRRRGGGQGSQPKTRAGAGQGRGRRQARISCGPERARGRA